jgi:hypothetical protein
VRFSVTVKMDPKIKRAIAAIPETTWTAIKYPNAVFGEDSGMWISGAEIAEITYTAFGSKKGQAVTARLIVRRVRDLNRKASHGQDEMFAVWRHHAPFTDSPLEMIQAEAQHRDHAIIEQVNADLISGPLAHLPPGDFNANAAWVALAGLSHNLLRATGCRHPAPARTLALAARLDEGLQRRPRPTTRTSRLTSSSICTAPHPLTHLTANPPPTPTQPALPGQTADPASGDSPMPENRAPPAETVPGQESDRKTINRIHAVDSGLGGVGYARLSSSTGMVRIPAVWRAYSAKPG